MIVNSDTVVIKEVPEKSIFEDDDIIRNDIGKPGEKGFGVGIYPLLLLPSGFSEMEGTTQIGHDNYGNYRYEDGSIMCWIPKFYYKVIENEILIASALDYPNNDLAKVDGFALHRAFIDDGLERAGFFYDKYFNSIGEDNIPVSIKGGVPFTFNDEFEPFPLDFSNDTHVVDFPKLRGADFFTTSTFIRNVMTLLSLAHGRASSDVTHCGWYDFYKKTNYPKGCNDGNLGDIDDSEIEYESATGEEIESKWKPLEKGLNSGSTDEDINVITSSDGILIAGFNSGYAAISKDSGVTWEGLEQGLGLEVNESNLLAGTGIGNTFVVGGSGGVATVSSDKGETWEELEVGLNSGATISDLNALASSKTNIVAGFSEGYASISTDDGESWEALPQGLNSGREDLGILSLASDNSVFVAGLENGFASISKDNGSTWEALERGLNSGTSTNNLVSLAISDDTILAGFVEGYAAISKDGGENWDALPKGLNSGSDDETLTTLTISGEVILAGFQGGWVSISRDLAATWEPIERGLNLEKDNLNISAVSLENPVVIFGFEKGYASRTLDIDLLLSIKTGYAGYPKTGTGVPFAKTTHNGQNCGIADVNGTRKEVTIGATFWGVTPDSEVEHDTPVIYSFSLKETVRISSLTGHWENTSSGYGAWGNRAHIEYLYEPIVTLITGNNRLGALDSPTYDSSLEGDQWLRTCIGVPLEGGFNTSGTETFGRDLVDITSRENKLFSFGGDQSGSSSSGVCSIVDSDIYSSKAVNYGYRCASYGY